MLITMETAGGSGGETAEKPTLLWSNASGQNSTITIDHSAYDYLIFVCGFPSNASVWGDRKKTTFCDKTQAYHTLAMGTPSTNSNTYMTAQIGNGSIGFPAVANQTYSRCYAIYGCNSLSVDYSEIWNDWDVA